MVLRITARSFPKIDRFDEKGLWFWLITTCGGWIATHYDKGCNTRECDFDVQYLCALRNERLLFSFPYTWSSRARGDRSVPSLLYRYVPFVNMSP